MSRPTRIRSKKKEKNYTAVTRIARERKGSELLPIDLFSCRAIAVSEIQVKSFSSLSV